MLKSVCTVLLIVSLIIAVILILFVIFLPNKNDCELSITSASGSAALSVCSGGLIFVENFNRLDKDKWQPEITLSGGSNGEFQWYVADDENSYEKDGKLYITPTLTADKIGKDQVEHGHILLNGCTDSKQENCKRAAGGNTIINPVRSARLTTKNSFSFKYGRIEILAKVPQGDWLWPAIWLLPSNSKYGTWPRSGEIDLVELRGNIKYGDNEEIGVEQMSSALHFGPVKGEKRSIVFKRNSARGFHESYHKYECIWDDSSIKFLLDGVQYGHAPVEEDGFLNGEKFPGDKIWKSGTKMAPFDEEFYFVINLAVGGNFFPDVSNKNSRRPWHEPQTAMKDFWLKRTQWLSTWKDKETTSLIVDYIKVYAI